MECCGLAVKIRRFGHLVPVLIRQLASFDYKPCFFDKGVGTFEYVLEISGCVVGAGWPADILHTALHQLEGELQSLQLRNGLDLHGWWFYC